MNRKKGKIIGCPKGSRPMNNKCRSIKPLTYHGRTGNPVIHEDEKGRYIMARKSGGGTKKIYLDKNGDIPKNMRK